MRLIRMLSLAVLATALAAPHAAAATPEQYIDSAFPYIAGEGGAPRLPMGELTAPDSPGMRYFKVRDDNGSVSHLYAHGPFAFAEGDQVASVNTDLVAADGGWRAASVPFDVIIPSDLDDGILWQDAGRGESVRIYPQNINSSPARMYEGSTDTVIYDQVWNHAYMTVAVTPNGIKDHIILTQANGVPNQFKFRVERPAGARTEITAAGAVHVIAADGTVLAKLPAPVARDRDHQEFKIWYEVENHSGFDVIVLRYDTSPITAEGRTMTYEAPFDLDPAIYSGSLVHGENAFRETSRNAYTVSDFNDGNLKASLLKVPSYDAGKFARWYITPPPAGSRWYSFSARVEGRVGITQKYSLTDDAGARYTFGPAAAAGTYFAQDVSFTPQGDVNSRIEATSKSTPLYDYYGQLTSPVVIYEDLVDPILSDLRPNNSTITTDQVTLRLGMQDAQSGCGTITVTLHGPVAPIGTRTGSGCTFAPTFNLRTEGTHRIDVVLTDRSGRQSRAASTFQVDFPLDPPAPPVRDGLDAAGDDDWSPRADAFSANWANVADAASYQLCFSTLPCAANDRWTGFSALNGTVGGYAFGENERVFACVRSISSSGLRTSPTCSNGQRVDTAPPTSPSAVRDGSVTGVDASRTFASYLASANWDAAFDDGSGVSGYESCILKTGVACIESDWDETGLDGLHPHVATELYLLEVGATYIACIRAFDDVGHRSSPACSSGQVAALSQGEVDAAIDDRAAAGLPADPQTVRAIMTNPALEAPSAHYGMPLTQAEFASIKSYQDRLLLVGDAIETWGSANARIYAGQWGARNEKECVRVGIVSKRVGRAFKRDPRILQLTRSINQANATAPTAKRCRAKIVNKKYSVSDFDAARDRILAAEAKFARIGAAIIAVSFDPESNRASIRFEGSAKVNKVRILARGVGRMPVGTVSRTKSGAMHNRGTWLYRYGRVTAGIKWQDGSKLQHCTAGFTLRDGSSGRNFMTSAKHCDTGYDLSGEAKGSWYLPNYDPNGDKNPPSYDRYRISFSDKYVYDPGFRDFCKRAGSGQRSAFGETYAPACPDLMLARFKEDKGYESGKLVIRAPRRAEPWASVVNALVRRPSTVRTSSRRGSLVCRSGANDDYDGAGRWGFRCGYLIAYGGTNGADTSTNTVCPGDSGGPVYARSGDTVVAVGVTAGGDRTIERSDVTEHRSEGGTSKNCYGNMVYEPLRPALQRFNADSGMALTVKGDI